VRRLPVTASVVSSPPILVTLMKEALVPRKRSFLQEPHGVTSQKTPFFIVTAVKTLYLTSVVLMIEFFVATEVIIVSPTNFSLNFVPTSFKCLGYFQNISHSFLKILLNLSMFSVPRGLEKFKNIFSLISRALIATSLMIATSLIYSSTLRMKKRIPF
jgi:hypothetical protein